MQNFEEDCLVKIIAKTNNIQTPMDEIDAAGLILDQVSLAANRLANSDSRETE